MQQLIKHVSQESASRCDFFPYSYGRYTSVLTWVESKPQKGQRLITRTYSPFGNFWPKPKESAYHDLVFLFRNPYTGFAEEQLVNLHELSHAEVLHIVSHYYLTPSQKETVKAFLSRIPNSVYTVWSKHEVYEHTAFVEIVPFRHVASEILNTYPSPDRLIPEPDPIAPAKPAGRPPVKRELEGMSAVDKKRLKLHDKEALDIPKERRAFYYDMQGRQNPDTLSDAQVEAMS